MKNLKKPPVNREKRMLTPKSKMIEKVLLGVIICSLVILFLLYKLDPSTPTSKEIGKLVNVFTEQTGNGSITQYVVQLQSGEEVKFEAPGMGPYKKGRVVVVEKSVSKIFQKINYRFINYVE